MEVKGELELIHAMIFARQKSLREFAKKAIGGEPKIGTKLLLLQ